MLFVVMMIPWFQDFRRSFNRTYLRASTSGCFFNQPFNDYRRFVSCVFSRLFSLASSYQFQNARGERDEGNKVNVRVMAKALLSTTRDAEPEERNVRVQFVAREGHPRRTRSRSDKESNCR